MKAAFIERFTRFIEWPENAFQSESFKILILGENPFGTTLEKLFAITRIKNREVEIKYSGNTGSVKDCQIVYISPSCKKDLKKIVELLSGGNILSIGDTEGYADQGVMINFFIDKNVLRFELNIEEIKKSKMKVSTLLEKVAVKK
ncbi:MAG: YfiR family protein [Desulfobacteraceae bacterium]